MLSPKTVLTTAVLTATLAPAASAAPHLASGAHFYAYAKITQKTTWQDGGATTDDCFHHWTGSDHGTDTLTVTTKPFRVSLLGDGAGGQIVFYGGDGVPASGLPAHAKRTTQADSTRSVTAGPCGPNDDIVVTPLWRCGSVSWDATVNLEFSRGTLAPHLGAPQDSDTPTSLANCPVSTPPGADLDGGAPEPVASGKLDLQTGKRLVVNGGRTWSNHTKTSSATTTLRWTVRLLKLR